MNKYIVKYYFAKDFYISRLYPSDFSMEVALFNATCEDNVKFRESTDQYVSFKMEDVIFTRIEIEKQTKIQDKPAYL